MCPAKSMVLSTTLGYHRHGVCGGTHSTVCGCMALDMSYLICCMCRGKMVNFEFYFSGAPVPVATATFGGGEGYVRTQR